MKPLPLAALLAPVPLDGVLVPCVQCFTPASVQPHMALFSKSQDLGASTQLVAVTGVIPETSILSTAMSPCQLLPFWPLKRNLVVWAGSLTVAFLHAWFLNGSSPVAEGQIDDGLVGVNIEIQIAFDPQGAIA